MAPACRLWAGVKGLDATRKVMRAVWGDEQRFALELPSGDSPALPTPSLGTHAPAHPTRAAGHPKSHGPVSAAPGSNAVKWRGATGMSALGVSPSVPPGGGANRAGTGQAPGSRVAGPGPGPLGRFYSPQMSHEPAVPPAPRKPALGSLDRIAAANH